MLLAKKYVGTLLNKTGFVGRILFSRGSVASFNYTDFVDVSVTVAYNGNLVRLLRRSGATVAAAKIVEVTYNSEVYFALYRPVASEGEVVATGHAFNAALPLLIPDATAYTITDVVTTEEDYHVGNKPTAKDLNVVDRSGDTMTGDLVNSRRFIITDANGSSSQFEARNGDMMAIFRTSAGGAILGAQTGGAWDGYIKVGKDAGFSYTPKGGSTEFQVYHQGFKPTPADVGALASGGTAVNAGGVKLNYRWSTPEHDFNDGGNTDQDLKFYWHGSANVNGPTDGSGAKTSGYGITYGNGVHGGQFELGYGSWPQFRSLINGNWSEWNKLYHTGFKPTPADVGALPVNANAVSATKLLTARTINGTNFDGTANITTVNWGTARTLTIGNTAKSVNGGADVAWSLDDIGAARAMPLKLGSADGKPRSSRLLSIAKTDSSCSFVISSQGDFGNRSRGWYQVSVATRGSLITVDAYSLNAKDSADPLKLFTVDTGSVFEVWGEFSDYNNDSSVLICSSHGATFFGDQMTSAKDWTGFSRIAINRIYTSNDKPTPADLGLGSLNNWEASSAVNLASDTTYATAAAVKKAYDLAAAALPADSNAVSATKLATARTISATGDATGSASFDGSANAAIALTLANSGVTAGTYGKVTVDAKGRVTAGLAMVAADIPSLDWSKISSGKPTTLAGYGITDAQAKHANLTALAGFTPAADRIPYFTSASAASVTPLTAFARSLLDDNDAAAARATLGVLSIEEPFKSAADVATTANLDATYANGSSGVGATLTGNVLAALSLDGVTCSVGMRVLVKNQTAAAQNGVYTVTNAGSSTVAWVLTRATDADTTAKLAGAVVTVDQGTSNGSMLLTNDWKKTSVVGTTAMNWRVVIDSGNVSSYHHASGVTAGTYRSVTVNSQGHVTGGSNPTTLSGYGITDAAPSSHVSSGGGAHATATTAAHGFMSSTDKAKLDSIASNANNYAHPAGDGDLHVPATGTSNNGKYLMAGAAAGSLSWQSIDAAGVGAVPVSGGSMSGALTVNNEIRTTSANSMRMVYGNYGTFWRQDGANMYLMFTNAGDQYGGYNSLRPMSANLANGSVNFGHAVDVAGNLSVNTGSTSWIDMRTSAAIQGRSAVATSSASAIVRQEHADRHFILGGLGNSQFGFYMINKSRTVNGTDAGAYLSADGTWYCGGNVSANDYQVRSDRRLKSEFTEIKDAWDLWKTLQISEYTKEGAREYGFIAQDFEKNHKPAIAKTMTDDYLNLKPMSVLAIAGKVIQSLQDRVENLENALKECLKRMEVGDASTS
ncbi:tail fiber domain-containing protein [Aeromonas hydrophila]